MFGGYTQEVIGTSVFGERFDSQTVPETNGAVSVVPPEAALDPREVASAVATLLSGDFDAHAGGRFLLSVDHALPD